MTLTRSWWVVCRAHIQAFPEQKNLYTRVRLLGPYGKKKEMELWVRPPVLLPALSQASHSPFSVHIHPCRRTASSTVEIRLCSFWSSSHSADASSPAKECSVSARSPSTLSTSTPRWSCQTFVSILTVAISCFSATVGPAWLVLLALFSVHLPRAVPLPELEISSQSFHADVVSESRSSHQVVIYFQKYTSHEGITCNGVSVHASFVLFCERAEQTWLIHVIFTTFLQQFVHMF